MVNLKLCFFLFLIHLPSLAISSDLCNSDQHLPYCKSLFSLHKSLSQARQFLSQLDNLVPTLSVSEPTTLNAVEDCLELAESNIDFLSSSLHILNTTRKSLSASKAEEVHTLISAVLTNHHTCLDGLQASRTDKHRLSKLTQLYGDTLSLFARYKNSISNHPVPLRSKLKMPNRIRSIYELLSSEKPFRTSPLIYEGEVVIKEMVTVSKEGSGNFRTIEEAVASAPNYKKYETCTAYFMISVRAGVYQEYITVDKKKKCLMIIGDGINKTVVTGNHSHAFFWSTFKSATFAVKAPNFVAMNITFRNTAGPENLMAVALRNDADMSAFYKCSFEAYQDTLYAHSLRQFYTECDIYGTVDFIFGNAAAVFQNCRIFARLPLKNIDTVTAQSRKHPYQNTGISIQNSTVEADWDLRNSNRSVRTYLGRPWREYSRTVFMECFMGDLIDPEGWYKWNGRNRVTDLYYAEYDNVGPGSNTSYRVTWPGYHVIDALTAANFTVARFIGGGAWLPHTGVPFVDGLLRDNRTARRVVRLATS